MTKWYAAFEFMEGKIVDVVVRDESRADEHNIIKESLDMKGDYNVPTWVYVETDDE